MNDLKNNSRIIFSSIFFSSLPVLFFMEPQTLFIIVIPFIYNILIIFDKIKKPQKKMLIFLTVFFTFILAVNFRELFSRDAGVPLLIVMAQLKILEMKNPRDELVACFLSFFILLSLILFSTSFFTTIYMFLSAVYTISVMGYINAPDKNIFINIKKSLYVSLPALLFAFLLFFFFPRIQSSLWGKHSSSKNVSGFAQTISPGSVSSLVKNDEVAFKVKFEEKNSLSGTYFRGIVFNTFDGISWHPDKPPSRADKKTENLNYQKAFIILYPTYSKYLISPDYPLNFKERGIYLTENSTLYSWYFKINDKKIYEVEFSNTSPDYPKPYEKHLKLPNNFNPKAVELGLSWINFLPEKRIEMGLKYFKDNNFIYTLNPPRYGRHYIDEFLFNEKKGFCEHFASSFAFLMRAAKVPSRIVGGYLGGEENSIAGFTNVRQSDAHAWCEVWVENKGWIRVDPTTESQPDRLEINADQIFSSDFGAQNDFFRFTKPILNIFDAMNFFWDQKIIGYNFSLQNKFFEFLGLKNQSFFNKIFLFIFVLVISGISVILVLSLKTKYTGKKTEELVLFEKLQKKIKDENLLKKNNEGYLEYLERIENSNIKSLNLIKEFINYFINERYSCNKSKNNTKKMKEILKKISL
ncbi:MAG: DUF3488 domain-containing transglutaminase family protein [Desulfobacteraceae bacterium]|nr:DUF3488 domain-containing transglutaminase family protein [Desulfobacteraceae bacterium]